MDKVQKHNSFSVVLFMLVCTTLITFPLKRIVGTPCLCLSELLIPSIRFWLSMSTLTKISHKICIRTGTWVEKVIKSIYIRDSSVGIALDYGLDDRGSRVRFPAGAGNHSLHHRVQNSSGAHPASYPMGTRGSFPGGKAAGAWSWPLSSISCRGQRMSGAIPPLSQYAFMAWCLVKAQGQLYLYLIHTHTHTHTQPY
jgi:hypothetical protein